MGKEPGVNIVVQGEAQEVHLLCQENKREIKIEGGFAKGFGVHFSWGVGHHREDWERAG